MPAEIRTLPAENRTSIAENDTQVVIPAENRKFLASAGNILAENWIPLADPTGSMSREAIEACVHGEKTSEQARAWFETEVLPGFSGATAQQLVEAGRGQEVLDYVAAVDAGLYA